MYTLLGLEMLKVKNHAGALCGWTGQAQDLSIYIAVIPRGHLSLAGGI